MADLRAFWLFTILKLKKIWSFKANLISQITGMFINNLFLILMWWLLFARFGSINGYSFKEIILIYGFSALFYAFFYLFFGGAMKLSDYISQDRFLDLQLYPVNPLTILSTKSGAASQIGDFLQGSLMIIIYLFLNPSSLPWIILGILITVFGLFGVTLFFNSILFFFPKILDSFWMFIDNLYIGVSMYPSKNFSGILRYFLYFLLAIPLISFPVEIARGFLSPKFFIVSFLAAILANFLGFLLWNKGIKKVESGSSGGIVE